MNFKINNRGVLGEVIITIIATIIIIFILFLFAYVSGGIKILSGNVLGTGNEYDSQVKDYDAYFVNFGTVTNFRFSLSQRDDSGKLINGFEDSYNAVVNLLRSG